MDEFAKHFHEIWAMDLETLGLIAALCLASGYFLKDYLANPVMIVFAGPVLFICSVLTQYMFILMQFYAPNKLDQWLMWTVFSCILGNIVGIAITAGMGRLRDAVTAVPPPKPAGAVARRQ